MLIRSLFNSTAWRGAILKQVVQLINKAVPKVEMNENGCFPTAFATSHEYYSVLFALFLLGGNCDVIREGGKVKHAKKR